MRNVIALSTTFPYVNWLLLIVKCKSEKFPCAPNIPIKGVIKPVVKAASKFPNDCPITTATASSIKFPWKRNERNPLIARTLQENWNSSYSK